MHIAFYTVHNHLGGITSKLRVNDSASACRVAVNHGLLDLDAMLGNLDPMSIERLTPAQKGVLKTMANNPSGSSNVSHKTLATTLSVTRNTIKNHLADIHLKLGVYKTQAMLLYMAYQRLQPEKDTEETRVKSPQEQALELIRQRMEASQPKESVVFTQEEASSIMAALESL